MCGIAGAISRQPDRAGAAVERMVPRLRHRGPDGEGVLERGPVVLGHTRLSVVDLSTAGSQPMVGPDGRVAMTYNGELYGCDRHRAELAAHGRAFGSTSDSEVLLALYERHGPDAFPLTNGMMAAAFHDERAGVVDLVRDRLGIKPLFWARTDDLFVFASELPAVLAGLGRRPALRADALAQYLLDGFVSSPATVFTGVHQLPAGQRLRIDLARWPAADAVTGPVAWWEPAFTADDDRPAPMLIDELEALVLDAVDLRRVADVPLGALLSGGVDSGLVTAALASSSATPVETFTITTPGHERDESAAAAAVARHVGSRHHELATSPTSIEAYWSALAAFGQPFNCPSLVNARQVSELARSRVTVALSGDGGDELFAGYGWYRMADPPRRWAAHAAPLVGRLPTDRRGVPRLAARSLPAFDRAFTGRHPVGIGEAERLCGTDLSGWVDSRRELWERWPADDVTRATYLDVKTYLADHILAKVDRASMAVALEVRVPLLDYRVVEMAGRLPVALKQRPGTTKWILKQVADRHLPAGHTARPKVGFDPPLAEWFFDRHLRACLDELTDPRAPVRELVDTRLLDRWIADSLTPPRTRIPRRSAVWALYQLDRWLRGTMP